MKQYIRFTCTVIFGICTAVRAGCSREEQGAQSIELTVSGASKTFLDDLQIERALHVFKQSGFVIEK